MEARILHIMLDEKVISRTIRYFEESLPGDSKYIIVLSKGEKPELVNIYEDYICYTEYNNDKFWRFVGDVQKYQYIVFHFLSNEMVDFILKIPKRKGLVWIEWGTDLYSGLLEEKGYQLYAYPPKINGRWIYKIVPYLHTFLNKRQLRKRESAVKRISIGCIPDCDYKLLIKYYPDIDYERRGFFYYPIDDILGEELIGKQSVGNNIIVGNSASYTNNHRLAFEQLSKYDLGERKVIVPLSYGKAKDYVLKCGNELIGRNFTPLIDFLSLTEYNRILLSANLFIYANFRQEALGNIIVALYLGAIVVLDKRNPLYGELISKGLVVFLMDDLSILLQYHMTPKEINNNRNIISRLYSRERMIRLIKESFGN